MLFCVYRVKDGDIYTYDKPVGNLHSYDVEDSPRMEEAIDLVVGGTGAFKGSTGVWLGVAEGRGPVTNLIPTATAQLPRVLLKIMDSYVKTPRL